jgi:hypothetical protein
MGLGHFGQKHVQCSTYRILMEIRKYLEDQIRLRSLSLASPLTDEDRMKINKPTDIRCRGLFPLGIKIGASTKKILRLMYS